MRRRGSRTWRITPLGAVIFAILGAAAILVVTGSNGTQAAGAIVAAVIVVFLVIGSVSGGQRGISSKGLKDRRAEFEPDERGGTLSANTSDRDELWRREKLRYDEKNKPR